MFMG
jgi:hypothetical protein